MDPAHREEGDLVDELGELVRQLKVYLKWQQEEGAFGIPRDARPPAELITSSPVPAGTTEPRGTFASRGGEASSTQTSQIVHALSDKHGGETSTHGSEPRRSISTPAPADIPAKPKSPLPLLGTSLEDLRQLVKRCTACSLHEGRKQTVFSRGQGSSGLVFLGEGPGADEDEQGLPFVGAAGQLLDKMIGAMGFSLDEVYVCNIVKCRPPNNRKPSDDEMLTCSPFLEQQLALIKPQVIVALGGTATTGLLGDQRGITKIRGKFRLYGGEIAVMPTFHPAYLLRNPAAKREVWSDLRQVVQHMGRSLPPP